MAKTVYDKDGEEIATITSNHGCLKFFGYGLGVCTLLGCLVGYAGWQGVVFAILVIVVIGFGLYRKNNGDSETTGQSSED